MTISAPDLAFYALGILLLFLTPGPVWVALTARALTGGFRAAWPLAVGVSLGDILWPFLAILGMGWILSIFENFLDIMKWVACATFLIMGLLIIRNADKTIGADSKLTKPGMWAGFLAGVTVILANPKAILFYGGMLPGFFDVTKLTAPDIAAILAVSVTIPLIGNLCLAYFIGTVRGFLTTPGAIRRTNLVAGTLLICVGLIIPLL
jgi:threonine/homoserine/homoserine lactone efflux protein